MRIVLAGASGEVGSSLATVLQGAGHVIVPVTFRPANQVPAEVVPLAEALALISLGGIDLVVNAAGPGDRRAKVRDVRAMSSELAAVAASAAVPSVLISTLRVCEGFDGPGGDDAEPFPLTAYAQANAEHELAWLKYSTAMVLRMTNYFCTPQAAGSPQSLLLPWSLLQEGFANGHIGVRSGSHAAKSFVSDVDVAAALALLARERPYGRCIATLPGVVLNMEQLVSSSLAVLAHLDRMCTVSFGSELGVGIDLPQTGWLAERGWMSSLSLAAMQQQMLTWLVQWDSDLLGADEGGH